MVTFVIKEDAAKLFCRGYRDRYLKMSRNYLSLLPQYMQIRSKSWARINFEIRMALYGSKVLSCDREIEAICPDSSCSGSIKCHCSMEKLETWVATCCDVEREFHIGREKIAASWE